MSISTNDFKLGITRVLTDAFASSTVSENPKVIYIVSGQGGGKTSVIRHKKNELKNTSSDKKLVIVKDDNEKIETGLKKFGAMIGDNVEVGCGSVLNPGSIIGRNTNIYPLSSVRGIVPADSIYKNKNEIVDKR